jgi:hypothetical protein
LLVLLLLLGGQPLLLSDQAYSQDCSQIWCCDWCWIMPCYCWGTHPCCPGQVTDDSSPFRSSTIQNPGALYRIDERELIPAAVAKLDVGDGLMKRIRGSDCVRRKSPYRLLGKAAEGIKFEAIRFDETTFRTNTVSFQIAADAGK